MINLYPDQQEQIEAVAQSMRGGNKSVLMQAATGAGKSYMASELIRRSVARGKRAWFTVPRKTLITQMDKTFDRFDIDHSFIASTKPMNKYKKTFICSTETLKNRLDKPEVEVPDLIVIDETRYGMAGLDKIIKWGKSKGCYIVGLDATPWKMNGMGLGCWYDDMVQGKSIRWLIDNKRLSEYHPYAPSKIDMSGAKGGNAEYTSKELEQALNRSRQIVGDAISHYKKLANGLLNITYCVSIDESERTAQAYRDAGISAIHLDGKTPTVELEAAILAFARREITVICNCQLLCFGFDLASQVDMDVTVECVTDLAPSQSLANQMQKWGRALRKKDKPAIILDHAGNFEEHGLPCEDRNWTLDDISRKKRGDIEVTISVKICKKCFSPHRTHQQKCPFCGFVNIVEGRTVEMVEGELVKLEIKHEKKVKRMEVGRIETYEDLKRIGKERGYKSSWAWVMAKKKGIKIK